MRLSYKTKANIGSNPIHPSIDGVVVQRQNGLLLWLMNGSVLC